MCVGEIYIERESRNQRKIEDEKKEEYEKCLYLRIYVIYQSIDLSMYLCIYMCMHVCMHVFTHHYFRLCLSVYNQLQILIIGGEDQQPVTQIDSRMK